MSTQTLLELAVTLMFLGVSWAKPYNLLPYPVRSLPIPNFVDMVKAWLTKTHFVPWKTSMTVKILP